MRDTERGTTLVELLMAAGLSLTLLTLLIGVLVPTLRASARGTTQVSLQESGLLLLDRLGDDLGRSVWAGLGQLQADPLRMLSIHRLAQIASDGSQVWEDSLVVYQWQSTNGQVMRKLMAPSSGGFSTSSPFSASGALLQSWSGNPGTQARILAGQVSNFQVSLLAPGTDSGQTVSLQVVLQAPVPGRTDLEQVQFNRNVYLRNQSL